MSQFNTPFESSQHSPSYQGPSQPMSGMAVGSLVIGILATLTGVLGFLGSMLSVLCCCAAPAVVAAPVALLLGVGGGILGWFGMQECKTGAKRGHGLALAGVITSLVGGLFGALMLLALLGLFAFAAANQPPNRNF